jgi:hypothetical protein
MWLRPRMSKSKMEKWLENISTLTVSVVNVMTCCITYKKISVNDAQDK